MSKNKRLAAFWEWFLPCQMDLISIVLFTRGMILIFGNCIGNLTPFFSKEQLECCTQVVLKNLMSMEWSPLVCKKIYQIRIAKTRHVWPLLFFFQWAKTSPQGHLVLRRPIVSLSQCYVITKLTQDNMGTSDLRYTQTFFGKYLNNYFRLHFFLSFCGSFSLRVCVSHFTNLSCITECYLLLLYCSWTFNQIWVFMFLRVH